MLHIQIAIKQKLSSAIPHLELQTLKIFEVAEVIARKGMPQRVLPPQIQAGSLAQGIIV